MLYTPLLFHPWPSCPDLYGNSFLHPCVADLFFSWFLPCCEWSARYMATGKTPLPTPARSTRLHTLALPHGPPTAPRLSLHPPVTEHKTSSGADSPASKYSIPAIPAPALSHSVACFSSFYPVHSTFAVFRELITKKMIKLPFFCHFFKLFSLFFAFFNKFAVNMYRNTHFFMGMSLRHILYPPAAEPLGRPAPLRLQRCNRYCLFSCKNKNNSSSSYRKTASDAADIAVPGEYKIFQSTPAGNLLLTRVEGFGSESARSTTHENDDAAHVECSTNHIVKSFNHNARRTPSVTPITVQKSVITNERGLTSTSYTLYTAPTVKSHISK